MKKNFHFFLFLFLFLLLPVSLFAQLSGSYSIPGAEFSTIELAVDSLNQVGVGAGGVTFNVAAGHTESVTDSIAITATGTAITKIVDTTPSLSILNFSISSNEILPS